MQAPLLLSRARSRANMDLLRGGFGPSVDQARLLHDDSNDLVLELAKVTDDIRRLTVLHRQISRQLGITRSTLAPIRRLPAELLVEIFVHFVETSWTRNDPLLITTTLARVCRHWRGIVWNTARLWSHIQATYEHSSSSSVDIASRAVKQASLAAPSPLVLTAEEKGHNLEPTLLKQLLVHLGPHTARLRTINYRGRCPSFPEDDNINLSALQTIDISIPMPWPRASLTFLSSTSALKRLNLRFWPESLGVDMGSLELTTFPMLEYLEFVIEGCPPPTVLALLSAHRKTLLGVTIEVGHFEQWMPSALPTMARLRSVNLGDEGHRVLRCITAPVLQEVRLYSRRQLTSDPFRSLFESSSISTIGSLTLEGLEPTTSCNFRACLKLLRGLRTLDIAKSPRESECKLLCEGTLVRLTLRQDQAPRLVHLTKLTLTYGQYTPTHPSRVLKDSIRSMLASRKDTELCASLGVEILQNFNTDIDYMT
ncbi:uncharacterized protein SCHCODRAFT_02746120 [Schizophyllum commune H4-8]|nr:uncharacterized protein SCHCODRAFT_02746120 [Schizophyllum commune H4-8]KAI5894538.1 hypothetical protein SCHCODRAFT_02746120 [Schizophyllum commune H4-8]